MKLLDCVEIINANNGESIGLIGKIKEIHHQEKDGVKSQPLFIIEVSLRKENLKPV